MFRQCVRKMYKVQIAKDAGAQFLTVSSHVLYTPALGWRRGLTRFERREVAKEGTPSTSQSRLGHLSVNISAYY